MRREMFIAFVGAVASIVVAAEAGLSVTVALDQRVFLPGEPITARVTIANTSGTAITFFGTQPEKAVRVSVRLKNEAGEIIMCGGETSGLLVHQNPNVPPPQSTLGAGECIQLDCPADTFSCPLSRFPAGRYVLRVEVTKAPKWETDPWSRLALLEENIEIASPTGEDLAVLQDIEKAIAARAPKNLKGGTLQERPLGWSEVLQSMRVNSGAIILARHPTSTYAAYVVYGYMIGWAGQNPAAVLGGVEGGMFNSNSYPDDTGKSKDGWRSMKGNEAADWWAKWYEIILKNHPDIWFADELRLKRAVDQVALKNYQAGAAELEQLCSTAKPDVAEKARQYLGLMKQKGWIKE